MGDMPELDNIPELKDTNGNPLVVENSYRIKLKNNGISTEEQLAQFPGHNKMGVLKEVKIVDGDTPSGTFLIDGKEMDFNNYNSEFIPCLDSTCSVSGGKRRSRRSSRRRSKRRRTRRFA